MKNFEPIIKQYQKRLTEIKEHIKFISLQKDLFTEISINKDMNKYSHALEKILNSTVQYNSIIICLYGCFEEFIDELALAYLHEINNLCKSYDDLPKPIRDKHLYKVGEFLSNPQRYKGYELTIEECINNMYSSINSCEEKNLNSQLIISHSANLNFSKVCDLYKDLGIDNPQSKIKKRISNEELIQLDELVEQRNTISHSWEVEQRYSYEKIESHFADFLMKLGEQLKCILTDNLYIFMIDKNFFEKFDKAINVINNRILCINSKDSYLEKGDTVLCRNSKGDIKRLKILNIQHKGIDIEKINEKNIDVGIEVSNRIKKNCEYYYLKNKNDINLNLE